MHNSTDRCRANNEASLGMQIVRFSVDSHWRQQFTCPTTHVLKYSLSLVRAHTKSATCRSVGAILCVLQPGLSSVTLSDKGKGVAISDSAYWGQQFGLPTVQQPTCLETL
ncbi:hypothetical protein PoB_000254900 [Plakobranchus ocellatus]|uniref:Uncharacterized protein n=1 Tax=Plakobranchus ocellatus TaxID=259542 RepID=A0AAV3Y245_9GAST|nr:hypothetical protein PoB_000254900 [Plakobranchus ocellatus]